MIRKELREKRAALLKENRDLLTAAGAEKRELTGPELEQLEKRNADVDRLTRQIDAEERQDELEARAGRPNQGDTQEPNEFRTFGHFVHEVRFNPAVRAMSMGNNTEGGFAVPTQFRAELLQVSPQQAIIRPRATVIPAGDPPDAEIKMPALDQGTNGVYGGVTVTWISEGATKPETTTALKEVSLTPNEVAAHIVVTDKLLRNWQASGPLLARLLRNAIIGAEEYKFLQGNGVGCPKGLNSAAARILINRGTAGAVKFADVGSMLGRMSPDGMSNAIWVASISVLPSLVAMSSDSNSVSTIFIRGDVTKSIPSTLFGLPIYFTGRVPTLGTAGDLMLVDPTQYLIKDGSGPFVAASEHVNFTTNKTVIKAFWNVDADCWWAAPLTLEDGSTTVSPVVVLN